MSEKSALLSAFSTYAGATVLVVGDVMLDRFVYGSVDRISPEAPIPVFLVTREKEMLGGAGNVVANIVSLGASAKFVSVIGNDPSGATLSRLLSELNIGNGMEVSDSRSTILKTRFIGAGQQMLRVDREKTDNLSTALEDRVIDRIKQEITGCGAVILSDYGKGMLTDRVITETIAIARSHNIPVIVDPKGRDFTRYKGATVITPNRKELETATGMKAETDAEVITAAGKIVTSAAVDAVLATRSKDGMSLVRQNDTALHIPVVAREIFDVSGAGDTVIATFAAGLAAGVSMEQSAHLSNFAAAIAVGKPGTATVRPDELQKSIEDSDIGTKNHGAPSAKIVTLSAAADQAERWRARGYKVGFTNGTFDLLHPGHISSIRQAKSACDYLVVGMNSDASVKRYKGPTRPVQDETSRATILAALEMVDLVIIFEEDTPVEILRQVKPDFLIKGGQYKLEEVVGYDIVQAYGGQIIRADMVDGQSTTNTIEKMNADAK